MSTVITSFPDGTYTSSNKPSVETLKTDIQALETGHNELETRVVAASTSAAGTVELATTAETTTGTDTTRAVTPDGLHDMDSLAGAAWMLDTDAMTEDSAVKVPSQQSVKAYVDTSIATQTSKTYVTPIIKAWDGWNTVSDSWTYASATTITVPSGAASLYQKGDKIKLTQTTPKYFYITSVADTVLTVTGGSDYTVANAAITSPYYSHVENPIGFPTVFNYTPTFASAGTQPVLGSSTITGKFWIKGSVCWYTGKLTVTTGGSWSAGTGTYRFGLPVTSSAQQYRGQGTAFDNGTADFPQLSETQASTAYCILVQCSNGNNVGATVPMTPATGDYYIWTGFFDF